MRTGAFAGDGGQPLFLDPPTREHMSLAGVAARSLIVVLLYVATGYAGLRMAFIGESVTLFWPPSGLALAVIWLGGRRFAPAIAIGAFAINLLAMPPILAALVAFGNTLSAIAAVTMLSKLIGRRSDAGELLRVFWFILAAVLGCTALSATAGTIAVELLPGTSAGPVSTWFVWWLGDAMGMLIVAPPMLLWRRIATARYGMRDMLDATAFAAAGTGIIAGLALINQPLWAVELCKLFTLLLSLWAGARFGLNGPSAIALLMAVGAVEVTVFDIGPFARGSFYDRFALVHSYLFAEAVAGMLLAAAIADLRRALVRERRALELAEMSSSSRVRLLTIIGHDVRTPHAGIAGVLQLLQSTRLDPEQSRLVALGLRAGDTVTALIDEMMKVARLDVGTITLDPAPFELPQSLADVLDYHRHDAANKGLGLELRLDPALPKIVVGDRVRIEQLVGNLVANAVAYTKTGRVLVSARWDGVLHVAVADTGPGIRPDAAPHIFDAFTRADGDRPAGLGLGLHICQQLTELMGGALTFRPGTDGGSCFQVELPLREPASPTGADAEHGLDDPQRRVLLVEDDPIAREIAVALLASHGHEVAAVHSSAAAPAMVMDGGFDLILMDVHDRGDADGGLAATRAIRRLPGPNGRVKVIALTGDAEPARLAAFQAAGMDGALAKPLTLAGGLAAALRGATWP